MQPISSAKHKTVVDLLLSGHSIRETAKKSGVSKSTVGLINKEIQPIKENIKTGRPSTLSPHDRRRITNQIKTGELDNATQATEFINDINSTSISPQTVRNALKGDKMKAVVKRKRPLLTAAHTRARLKFALKYQHWTVDDWKLVLWSDETKINRIGSDGRV